MNKNFIFCHLNILDRPTAFCFSTQYRPSLCPKLGEGLCPALECDLTAVGPIDPTSGHSIFDRDVYNVGPLSSTLLQD